jgi:SAM-dependent methyltransferase
LITVASGAHWFDMEPFLHEVKRILKPTGKLVLYDNYFLSKMEGNPTFSTWYPEVYLDKFPAPPRNSGYDWSNENLNQKELKLEHAEEFENEIPFTKSDLILYFTTQSNITAVIEAGKMTYEEVENWLDKQLTPFFTKENQVRNIVFGNWLKIIGVVKKV